MTWAEFKKAVEALGVKDEDIVSYIDCYPGLGTLRLRRDQRDDGRKYVAVIDDP